MTSTLSPTTMRRQRIPRPISQPARTCDRAIRDAIREIKGTQPPPAPASIWYNAVENRTLSYNGLLTILASAIADGKSEAVVQAVPAALSRWISAQYPVQNTPCPLLALVAEAEIDAEADVAQALALAERSPSAYLDAADETERLGHHALFAARVLRQAAHAQTPAVRSA